MMLQLSSQICHATIVKIGQEECPGNDAPDFRLSVCSETYGAMLGTPPLTAKSIYCPGGAMLLLGGPVQAMLFPEDALQSSTTYTTSLPLDNSKQRCHQMGIMARHRWHT